MNVTGQMEPKPLAAYLKRAHKDRNIYVEKTADALYLCDSNMLVKTTSHPLLSVWTEHEFDRAKFSWEMAIASPWNTSLKALWEQYLDFPLITAVQCTPFLFEAPRYKQPSLYYRRLEAKEPGEDGRKRAVWVDRAMLDVFSPDPDDLNDFLLEMVDTGILGRYREFGMLRIAGAGGYVAFCMPISLPGEQDPFTQK